MKTFIALVLLISLPMLKILGQGYSLYSNDSLLFQSKYLGQDILLNLHLPETHPFSAETTKYPIAIVFDSQHENTYPQIIGSFNLLTGETQIPESIIIGVPFNMRNRRYFTSDQKLEGDSLSGIQRMELFLFTELLPRLRDQYKGSEFVSLMGHSRTAFLVNYLAFQRPAEVNLAISLSGFFNDKPLSIQSFLSFLTEPANFPNKFYYYYTAGTSLEESSYLLQYRNLDSLLKHRAVPGNSKIVFEETKNANHITNYWVSVPPILIDAFSEYNSILDSWLQTKLQSDGMDVSLQQFEADLENAGQSIGTKLNPGLTHIYSIASHFANVSGDPSTAISFFEYGLEYYPAYFELYVEVIELAKAQNDIEKVNACKGILREKVLKSPQLTASQREEYLGYLEEE